MNRWDGERVVHVVAMMFRGRAGHPMQENDQFESRSEKSSQRQGVFPTLHRQAEGKKGKNDVRNMMQFKNVGMCVDTNKN